MPNTLETFTLNALQPAQRPEDARQDACLMKASLTVLKGTALAILTTTGVAQPLVPGASDGTQNFIGFSMYDFVTDANGKVFFGTSSTASWRNTPWTTAPIWVKGIFDPADLQTNVSGTAVAEVDTFTAAGTVTAGDEYGITLPNGDSVVANPVTISATGVATAMAIAWNANPVAAALATTSGTATFILTSKLPGHPLGLTAFVNGVGTWTKVVTTAAVAGTLAQVETFTPVNPTTGDVYTITITKADGTTVAVSATVGSTQTATATVTLLKAAWAASSAAAAIATASGTSTLILTATVPGTTFVVAGAVVGTGTVTQAHTTPAAGRSITDLLPGCPGARVLHNGFWEIP